MGKAAGNTSNTVALGRAVPTGRVVAAGAAMSVASLLALGPAVLVANGPTGNAGRTVAAVFPPGWGTARSVAAAAHSAQIVGLGALPNIVIVHTRAPDQLRADGAWLFLNPQIAGCDPASSSAHTLGKAD